MAKFKKKLTRKIRRIRKLLTHFSAYIAVRIFFGIFWFLSYEKSLKTLGFLGYLASKILIGEKKKIISNLKLAYGDELTDKEYNTIAEKVFINIGYMVADNTCLYRYGIEFFAKRITVKGYEKVKSLVESGQGIISITAHLDNWELLGAYISGEMKINFAVIARRMKNPYLDKLLVKFREKNKLKVFLREDNTRDLVRFLRKEKGAILGLLADQNFKGNGIYVNFFGKLAYTPTGPAELILFTKFPIVMTFITRNPDKSTHTIEISEPFSIELTDNKDENIRYITNFYTSKIEEQIKKYPDQWMWMHQRWREPR